MPWAVAYPQNLDPLNNHLLSILVAALPVLVLFYLLVGRRWLASKAGAAGAVVAILLAWLAYQMPLKMALLAFVDGVGFGLLPVGWTVFCAMLLYNITVETGEFSVLRRSVGSISGDARIQAVLIGFAFGALLEGAAGAGSPVAVCGAMLVGLGFHPFQAAVLCLIANTSPVAYGGLGTPIMTLGGVTDLPNSSLSVMAGRQLPFLSLIVPLYMVKCMCPWRQVVQVWPALLVAGGSFAGFQFFFASAHLYIGLELYYMTDVGGGIFSLVVTAIFLRFWRPRSEWHFNPPKEVHGEPLPECAVRGPEPIDPMMAAEAEKDAARLARHDGESRPLTAWAVARAWMPFALMSAFLLLTAIVRQLETDAERKSPRETVSIGPLQTKYFIPVAGLHEEVSRAKQLRKNPDVEEREKAEFVFSWLTAPGTPVFLAAVASMALLRMNRRQVGNVLRRTAVQMKVPIPTIACMLGLSYVTRYAGMDATLGYAFAEAGRFYPFFAAILGWLGVFLTGTDAGSNALFGSLQKITATKLAGEGVFSHLTLDQAQVLICTANSTGGVMGKMIDAQSICVATAATHQIGKEADIFKAVVWHSIFLASIVGLMTLLQAYVAPFTRMVPHG
jgi:lactate permease